MRLNRGMGKIRIMVFMLKKFVTQLLCFRNVPRRCYLICPVFTATNVIEQSQIIDFQLFKSIFSIDPDYGQVGKIPVFAYNRNEVGVSQHLYSVHSFGPGEVNTDQFSPV